MERQQSENRWIIVMLLIVALFLLWRSCAKHQPVASVTTAVPAVVSTPMAVSPNKLAPAAKPHAPLLRRAKKITPPKHLALPVIESEKPKIIQGGDHRAVAPAIQAGVVKAVAVVSGKPVYPDLTVEASETRIERHDPPAEVLAREGVLSFDRSKQVVVVVPVQHKPKETLRLMVYDSQFGERLHLDIPSGDESSTDIQWDGKDNQQQAVEAGRYTLKIWALESWVLREVIVR